jgi:hypothetical protein
MDPALGDELMKITVALESELSLANSDDDGINSVKT